MAEKYRLRVSEIQLKCAEGGDMCKKIQRNLVGQIGPGYRGGALSLVVFEKYILPCKKPHMRARFVRIDQGNKMQSLAGFFTGWKVVFLISGGCEMVEGKQIRLYHSEVYII